MKQSLPPEVALDTTLFSQEKRVKILCAHGFSFEKRISKNDLLKTTTWRYFAGSKMNFYEEHGYVPFRWAEVYALKVWNSHYDIYSRVLTAEERHQELNGELSVTELIKFRKTLTKQRVAKLTA